MLFSNQELDKLALQEYWNPKLYVENLNRSDKTDSYLLADLDENKEVYIIERKKIRGVFLETLELNDFPFDAQVSFTFSLLSRNYQ